jgi:hypothetical protein
MFSINSSATLATVPSWWRSRYCDTCGNFHVMWPIVLGAFTNWISCVGSCASSPSEIANLNADLLLRRSIDGAGHHGLGADQLSPPLGVVA